MCHIPSVIMQPYVDIKKGIKEINGCGFIRLFIIVCLTHNTKASEGQGVPKCLVFWRDIKVQIESNVANI